MKRHLYFGGISVESSTVEADPATAFNEFTDSLNDNPSKLSLPRAKYHAMEKPERDKIKRTLAFFLPCTFLKSPWQKGRKREHAQMCNLLCVDLDASEEARRLINNPQILRALGFSFLAYHTISSTPENPRIRIVIEADGIPPALYPSGVRTVLKKLGVSSFDRASLNPVQPMFVPVIFDGEHEILEGWHVGSFTSRAFTVSDIEDEEETEAEKVHAPNATGELTDDSLKNLPIPGVTKNDALAALSHLDREMEYSDYINVGYSIKQQFGEAGFDLFDGFFSTSSKYDAHETAKYWKGLNCKRRTIRALFHDALEAGWDGLLESGERWHRKGETLQVQRPLAAYSVSDLGNAEAIVSHAGHNIRYVPQQGAWLVWDGCRWQVDGTCTRLNQIIDECMRQWLHDAADIKDNNIREKALSRAVSFGDRKLRQNALEMAKHQPMIIMPSDAIDADPLLLGVPNGILDLKESVLLTNAQEHHITKSIATDFDPSATCPQWEKFIERVTRGHAGLAEFLQRSIGYSLTGLTVEHVFWFLHGCGKNGKSVFIETIQALAGEYASRASERLLSITRHGSEARPDELATLPGIRMLFGSETQEGGRLNEKFVKDLTGGDTVRAQALYKTGFNFRPVCKLWMFGNHKPDISGTDHGIWRRVRLIPFTAIISESETDPGLPDKLRGELPGILNWALAGLRMWKEHGLAAPQCVTSATIEYQSDQDTLGDFIEERMERGLGFKVSKRAAYVAYVQWAKENEHWHPLGSKTFSRRLNERGFRVLASREWADCRLKECSPFDDLEAFSPKLVHEE